ncbi:PAS domain S-box protein [Gemmatimonadota bacterium]
MKQQSETRRLRFSGPGARILTQIVAMVLVALVVGGLALFAQYRTAFQRQREHLLEMAQSQARLVEGMVSHHELLGLDEEPGGAFSVTLDELRSVHSQFTEFGESGEFILAERSEDRIVFLLSHRLADVNTPSPLPFDDDRAQPARRALSGESGTVVGLDYRGVRVLAAFEPVRIPGRALGVVVKIDQAEVRGPFLNTAGVVGLVALLIIVLGSWILHRVGEPMIRQLEGSERQFRRFFVDSQEAMFLSTPEGRVLEANLAGEALFGVPRGEFSGRDVREFYVDPEDRDRFREELGREGAVKDFEARLRRVDGEEIATLLSSTARRRQDGTLLFETVVRDITPQRRAEEALGESEAQFRSLAESSPSAIYIEQGGRLVYVNPAGAALAGASEDELTSPDFRWVSLIDPESMDVVMDAYRRHGAGEDVGPYEHRMITVDGRRRDLVNATCLVTFQGEPAVLGTISDITPQKEVQSRLRQERDRAQLYLDTAEVMLVAIDAEGRVEMINRKGCEILGWEEDELLGKPWFETCLPAEAVQEVHAVFNRIMSGELEPLEYYENEVVRRDGDTRLIAWHNAYVRDAEGNAIGTVSSGEDVTDLRESLQTSADIAETIPAGLFVYKCEAPERLTLVYANPEAEVLTGIVADEWLGKEFDEIWPNARSLGITQSYLEVARTGEVLKTEEEAYKDDRLEGVFRTHVFRLPGDRLAVSFENITERKKAEAEIRETGERMRALAARLQEIREDERTSIARELHDELGQAITGLRMDLAMFKGDLRKEEGELHERVDAMIDLADDNIVLVRSISSRLRPPVLDVLGLPAAVEWLVEEIEPRTELKFELDLPTEKPPLDRDASTAVFRVVQEALTNVLRHAEAHRVEISMVVSGGHFLVHVLDDGKGVSAAAAIHPRSLGLTGMRERALAMGGALAVGPEPGGGTRVTLTVPVEGGDTTEE